MLVLSGSWSRALAAALLSLALLLVVLLSAPAFLLWPFTTRQRQQATLQYLDRLTTWAGAILAGAGEPPARPDDQGAAPDQQPLSAVLELAQHGPGVGER